MEGSRDVAIAGGRAGGRGGVVVRCVCLVRTMFSVSESLCSTPFSPASSDILTPAPASQGGGGGGGSSRRHQQGVRARGHRS